eukprot:874751-Pleurochrysis_carterae.AAC.1
MLALSSSTGAVQSVKDANEQRRDIPTDATAAANGSRQSHSVSAEQGYVGSPAPAANAATHGKKRVGEHGKGTFATSAAHRDGSKAKGHEGSAGLPPSAASGEST